MGIIIALLVTLWTGYFIYQRYKPQPVLFMAGFALMFAAVGLGLGTILPADKSTGSAFTDAFEFVKTVFSSRAAGLGLNIMAVGGFARYMDKIGASRALVHATIRPLMLIRSPYMVLSATWVLGMFLGLAINSASGLAMLLMVTAFPILVGLGVSRLAAVAAIATTLCLDWSPSDTGTLLAAKNSGIEDTVKYWLTYQVPVAACVIPVVAVLHYFTQKWMDARDGHVVQAVDPATVAVTDDKVAAPLPPAYYALLPLVPLVLILTFSQYGIKSIKMDIIKAMFIGLALAMAVDWIATRNGRKVMDDIQAFFDGLGVQMANVVTLIVAGETFAKGLDSIGAINALISGAQASGFGAAGMVLVMVGIIIVCSIIMGSGNAPFFAFAAMVPKVAKDMAVSPVTMLLPMHLAASSARAMSPITAVIVVASSMGGVSPFDVVKRTAIPMIGSLITIIVVNFVLFYR